VLSRISQCYKAHGVCQLYYNTMSESLYLTSLDHL